MTNSKQDNESRLGHDPLEWLEEDIANLTNDEDTAQDENQSSADTDEAETEISAESAPEPQETEPALEQQEETEPEEAHTVEEVDTGSTSAKETSSEAPPTDNSSELISGFKLSKTDGTLLLPERLTVQVVESIHQDWSQIIDISDLYTLQINAEKLTELDAAGLQLLFAFSRELDKQSTKVMLINVSGNIPAIFKMAGLDAFFAPLMEAA